MIWRSSCVADRRSTALRHSSLRVVIYQTGRSAARQRACFGSRKSPVQIRAPRLSFNLTPDVGAFRLLSGSYVQGDGATDSVEGALHLAHVGAMVGICQPSHGGLADTQTAAELHF